MVNLYNRMAIPVAILVVIASIGMIAAHTPFWTIWGFVGLVLAAAIIVIAVFVK